MNDQEHEKRLAEWVEDAVNWVCSECGERCNTDHRWRWNGAAWEHHHGYPIGHVLAERVEK